MFWPDDLQKKKYAAVGAFGSQLLFERMSVFFPNMNGGRLGQLPRSSLMRALLIEKEVLSAEEIEYFDSLANDFDNWLIKRFGA